MSPLESTQEPILPLPQAVVGSMCSYMNEDDVMRKEPVMSCSCSQRPGVDVEQARWTLPLPPACSSFSLGQDLRGQLLGKREVEQCLNSK